MPKYFAWDNVKNEKLKLERGVGFEEVVEAWNTNDILDLVVHPNQTKYPGQKIMFVLIRDYVYAVPYVEDDEKYFLKTIYPSRKATDKYLKGTRKR